MRTSNVLASLVPALLALPAAAQTQPGEVLAQQKISQTEGGLPPSGVEAFGATGALGDVDGDGVGDLVVGAYWDDAGGPDRGSATILLLNPDGTVKAATKVVSGTYGVALDDFDYFGSAAAGIGDVDGDGVPDAAVAASGDDDGLGGPSSSSVGAMWILFLDAGGGVKGSTKISATAGGLAGPVEKNDGWFSAICALGDRDGDGVPDVAVGAQTDDDGAGGAGAVHLLYLNADGTVKAQKKISMLSGGFGGTLQAADLFGSAVAPLGDLDGDGQLDLAVGAYGDDDGAVGSFASRGAVWILFLDANDDVKAETKISDLAGGFEGELSDDDDFGGYLAAMGDLDGDGVADLAVGADRDDGDGGSSFSDLGAVWMLFLNADGTVKDHVKIGEGAGGLAPGTLDPGDGFGRVAAVGDVDGDGAADLAVGAVGDDDGGFGLIGAVHVLFLHDQLHGDPLGCGVNPPGSLLELSGRPALGETWTLGVENPLGTQPAGASAFVGVSLAPDPAFPCGTVVPGLGMASPAAPGELLVSVAPPNPVAVLGPSIYGGPGAPAPVALPIPNDPTLPGVALFVQGVLADPGLDLTLSEGLSTAVLLP